MDLAFAGRLLAACAIVALVLGAIQDVARRSIRFQLRRGARAKLLTVVETTYLPNASSLHVIRAAERYFVIGRSAAHMATLCEIPAESVAALGARPAATPAPMFVGELVARLRRRGA